MIILHRLEVRPPLPAPPEKFPHDGTVRSKNAGVAGPVMSPPRRYPPVVIDHGILAGVDVYGEAAGMPGESFRPRHFPVVKGGGVVVRHGGVVGPPINDDGDGLVDGKPQLFDKPENRRDIIPDMPVNNQLPLMEHPVIGIIPDIQKA
jgi:hypothetical protein